MAYELKLDELSEDLALMVHCVRNEEPDLRKDDPPYKRVEGGFENLDPFTPIYFKDSDYRKRKQEYIRNMIVSDEIKRNKRVYENRIRKKEKNNGRVLEEKISKKGENKYPVLNNIAINNTDM